jgi:hypothetical protein
MYNENCMSSGHPAVPIYERWQLVLLFRCCVIHFRCAYLHLPMVWSRSRMCLYPSLFGYTQVTFAFSHIIATVITQFKPQYWWKSLCYRSSCFMMPIVIFCRWFLTSTFKTWSFAKYLDERVHWIYHQIYSNKFTIIRCNNIHTCGNPPTCFGLYHPSSVRYSTMKSTIMTICVHHCTSMT